MQVKAFYKKFELKVFPSVYEPREDSFLLADSISVPEKAKCLDLGCGTGIVSLSMALQKPKSITATDLNEQALKCTKYNLEKHGFGKLLKTKKSDLFSNIKEKYDLISFNPPYVASEKIQDLSIDGGKKGRKVLDRFLKEFPKFLAKKGKCCFLQSSQNGMHETTSVLAKQQIEFDIIATKELFFEELFVFECRKI